MKVLIADGSSEVVARLDELLFEHPHVKEIYTATSYQTTLSIFNEKHPDVVLLDYNFPDNNSLKVLAEIKIERFVTKVIVLTNNTNDYIDNQFIARGANYIIDKNHEIGKLHSLLTAIKTGVPIIK
jgi:DNA-binding NarL/FixJ family response regulator